MAQSDSYRSRYEQWVRVYATELYRYAYRLTSRRQVAEDLLQETFTEAWKSVAKHPDIQHERAWLFQILRHRFSHFVRDGRCEIETKSLEENSATRPRDLMPSPLERISQRDELQTALQTLSPTIRETFLMVFMEGQTCRETAETLHIPLGTVLSRLDQARRSLRAVLETPTRARESPGMPIDRAEANYPRPTSLAPGNGGEVK
jgi:RNA polymerase sigma-70 factor (ECF subfamily)